MTASNCRFVWIWPKWHSREAGIAVLIKSGFKKCTNSQLHSSTNIDPGAKMIKQGQNKSSRALIWGVILSLGQIWL